MAYNPHTKIEARTTAAAIRRCLGAWKQTEYISMPERIDEAAEVVFDYIGTRVRVKHQGPGLSYRDNLRAIYLTLEDLRLIHVRGHEDLLTNTVSQMLQLGAGAYTRDPYEVLGVRPDAPEEIVEAAWKAAAKKAHPDHGGTNEAAAEINGAIERIRAERGAK